MSLRLALLALLEAEPATAYELAARFDGSSARLWRAGQSQIYPELKRLEAEGLVSGVSESRGSRARKTKYSIREEGCRVLAEWAETAVVHGVPRFPEYLKSSYLEWATFDGARRHFEAQRSHHERLIAGWSEHVRELRTQETPLLQARLRQAPDSAADAIVAYKVLVYETLIERSRAEMEGARRGIELVDRLQQESGLPGSARLTSPIAGR